MNGPTERNADNTPHYKKPAPPTNRGADRSIEGGKPAVQCIGLVELTRPYPCKSSSRNAGLDIPTPQTNPSRMAASPLTHQRQQRHPYPLLVVAAMALCLFPSVSAFLVAPCPRLPQQVRDAAGGSTPTPQHTQSLLTKGHQPPIPLHSHHP